MVNYVLSFCKITAASRIFSRNFYLPLLKPITPKDALRTLRITGKWLLGGKIQHYMPVLLNHRKKRSKRLKNYGKKTFKKAKTNDDYVFMMPILDEDNESHQLLLTILENYKNNKGVFVYTVDDKKYNIVLQSQFEKAIESGDVIDVLISKYNDKILVKLKNFKKIPIELQYCDNNNEIMYCGEGATTPEDEQFHHYGKYTMSLAKIFEDKEMEEERWEQELKRILKQRRRQKKEGTKEWKQMMNETMKNFNWEKFEEDAKKIIDEINEPPIEQELSMEIDDLERTKDVNEILLKHGDRLLNQLPTITEIPDIIKNMSNATLYEIETDLDENRLNKRRVSGVKVTLTSGKECFISGQIVHTEDGDVFVPGQTVENEFGLEYAPGITINIDNKPTLINGLIMGEEQQEPMFLPTQSTVTADGQLTFAATPEERQLQAEINPERNKNRKKNEEIVVEDEAIEEDENEQVVDDGIGDSDSEATIELNNSELEELDIEAIRLKQEQQRLELEKLKTILLDDGLDELIANLEQKNRQLKEKLEELRRLSTINNTNLVTYINEDDTMRIASKISDNYDIINRLSDILLIIIRRTANFINRNNINSENIHQQIRTSSNLSEYERKFEKISNKLKILLKTLIVVANDVFKNRPKDQQLALNSIGDICIDLLRHDTKILDELLDLMNTSIERNEICSVLFKQLQQNFNDSKQYVLKEFLESDRNQTIYDISEIIGKIYKKDNDDDNGDNGNENEIKSEAFNKIIKTNPNLVDLLKCDLLKNFKMIKTEEDVVDLLNNSIRNVIKIFLKEKYNEILFENGNSIDELRNDAIGFAKALSFDDRSLERIGNLSNDKQTFEFLQRVILIKQLSEKDYTLRNAIERLKKNPERSRSDPRIRQLICESALLYPTILKRNVKTSKDIPIQLIKQENLLALEDYLIQQQFNRINCPILINRNLYQMIIPKDSARSVLNGRIPYVLIDENGITKFKPYSTSNNGNNLNKNRDFLSGNSSDNDMVRNNRTVQQAKNNGGHELRSSNLTNLQNMHPDWGRNQGPKA